jgi:hypothetical protein
MIELSLRPELRSPFDFGIGYAQGEPFRGPFVVRVVL